MGIGPTQHLLLLQSPGSTHNTCCSLSQHPFPHFLLVLHFGFFFSKLVLQRFQVFSSLYQSVFRLFASLFLLSVSVSLLAVSLFPFLSPHAASPSLHAVFPFLLPFSLSPPLFCVSLHPFAPSLCGSVLLSLSPAAFFSVLFP